LGLISTECNAEDLSPLLERARGLFRLIGLTPTKLKQSAAAAVLERVPLMVRAAAEAARMRQQPLPVYPEPLMFRLAPEALLASTAEILGLIAQLVLVLRFAPEKGKPVLLLMKRLVLAGQCRWAQVMRAVPAGLAVLMLTMAAEVAEAPQVQEELGKMEVPSQQPAMMVVAAAAAQAAVQARLEVIPLVIPAA